MISENKTPISSGVEKRMLEDRKQLKAYMKTKEESFQKCIEREAADFLEDLKTHCNSYGELEEIIRSITTFTPHSPLFSQAKEMLKKEIGAILLDAPTTE